MKITATQETIENWCKNGNFSQEKEINAKCPQNRPKQQQHIDKTNVTFRSDTVARHFK